VSSAGSAHAWKFLPIIGDLVLDSMEGILSVELAEKWAWVREGDGGNHLKMEGPPKELHEVIRSRCLNGA
jgi:sarcosine oxidase/L-pipecolate oxidase